MADKIKIRRGILADIPILDEGEFGLVTDRNTVYIGTESSGNILVNPVLLASDGYTLDGYLYPAVDNVHGLGTPDKRWASVSVGPGSIHVIAKASDPNHTTNREYVIGVDPNSGKLRIVDSDTQNVLMELDSDTGASFPSGGGGSGEDTGDTELEHFAQHSEAIHQLRISADAYGANIDEHYSQFSEAIHQLRIAADAYGIGGTEEEHYVQQAQINQSILQALDGYTASPDLGAIGDGYIAFFINGGRQLAGDNDLFYDRDNSRLGINTTPTVDLDVLGRAIVTSDVAPVFVANRTSATTSSNLNALHVRHTTSGDMVDGFASNLVFSIRDNAGITNDIVSLEAERANSSDSTGRFVIAVANGGAPADRFWITRDGSTGILTGTPASTLGVAGNVSIGATYAPASAAPTSGALIEGSVGIGTTSVSANTKIATEISSVSTTLSNINVSNTSTGDAFIRFAVSSGTLAYALGIDNSDSDKLKIGVAGGITSGVDTGTLITLTTGGAFGLGTTTPVNRLDVEGGAVIGATYSGTNTAPTNGLLIEGSLGLGTTSVVNKLDVEGAVAIGATYSGTSAAPTNGAIIEGSVGIGTSSVSGSTKTEINFTTTGTTVSMLELSNDSTGDAFLRFGLSTVRGFSIGIDNSDSDKFKIGTAANASSGVDTGTLVTLTTAGQFGIGTTTPVNILDVEGAAAIGATYSGTSTAPTNGLIVEGNVGIGVTTPDQTLHVHKASAGTVTANSGATIVMENNGNNWLHALTPNTAHSGMLFGSPDDSLSGAVQFNAPPARGGISLVTGPGLSQTPLVASVDGLVGIRTSTPIEALTVVGSIAVNENVQPITQDGYGKIWVDTNGELNFVDDDGNNVLITTGGVVNAAGAGVQKTSGFTGADGYIAFWTGSNEIAGDNDLFYNRENSILSVIGGMSEVQVGDSDFRLDYAVGGEGVPGIMFDTGNDRIRYIRSSNSFNLDIAGTTVFSIGTNALFAKHLIPSTDDTFDLGIGGSVHWRNALLSGSIRAAIGAVVGFTGSPVADEIQLGDASFKLDFDGGGAGVPALFFDTNDGLTYNRSADALSINVNNIGRISISTDGYVQTLGDTPAEAATQIRISGSNAFTSGIEFYTATTERRGFVGWRGTSSGSGLTDTGMYLVNFDNTPLFLGTSSTNRVQITATDGYVGINGTPGPAGGVGPSRLQIFADAAGESMFSVRDGGNGVALEIISPATSQLFIRGGAGDNINFGTNGSNDAAITITSANEVNLPGFVAYASVTNLTDTTASASEYNPFASGSHAAYVENTNWQHNTAASMVVFTPSDGRFTVERTGVYAIECVVLMTQSATGILDNFAIRLNGSTTIWVAQPFVHSSVDPVERSINFYYSLSAGNYVELLVNSSAATTLVVDNGTTFNMRRIA